MEAPELVYLPGGTFLMGDERGSDDEKPVHRVRLPAFALGRTPVTWGDYRRFCEATDSHWPEWLEKGSQYHLETGTSDYYAKRGIGWEALDLPVVGVAWTDALAYCEWLRELTGKPYRLPTEAEWEYACRAGTPDGIRARWSFGDDESKLGDHAWYSANAEGRLHPVAKKRPNPWVLYDMHGNCWEWCADWYASDYYRQLAEASARVGSAVRTDHPAGPVVPGPQSGPYGGLPGDGARTKATRGPARNAAAAASVGATDASGFEQPASENPSGPESGSSRVIRGGAWNDDAGDCRSAYRDRNEPSNRGNDLGFRLSRTV